MKRLILSLLLGITLAFSLSAAPAAALFEGAKDQACQGINLTDDTQSNGCAGKSVSTQITIDTTLKYAINGFSLVVGVIAVIMVIVGGLKYITSSGESSNVNSAKNTILYAIIGLVVVALAQVILRFVLDRATGLPPCPAGQTTLSDGGACKAP